MIAGQGNTKIIQSNTTVGDNVELAVENQSQNSRIINLGKSQELIYQFLLNTVRTSSAAATLSEFKRLFIYSGGCNESFEVSAAIHEIIFTNQEHEFRYTLKRSCYILINNWETKRQHQAIQELVESFQDPAILRPATSISLQRLRTWLINFINSQDYQDLQTFVSRRLKQEAQIEAREQHWTERYAFYRLMAQSTDLNNPIEQQEAARNRALMLKNQFRFDLAMFIAKSQAASKLECSVPKNPTGMGDEVLRLVKLITLRRGAFSHENLANIFLKQTAQYQYQTFKTSLAKYLNFGLPQTTLVEQAASSIEEKISLLYVNHHESLIDDALLLRTCNRLIDYLTIEDRKSPSVLFKMLSCDHPFALITMLLKIYLICRHTASHLESRIGKLIQFYENAEENKESNNSSKIVNPISFFEVFNVVLTIHTGNVEYNIVRAKKTATNQPHTTVPLNELENYRIFSRSKQPNQNHEFGT